MSSVSDRRSRPLRDLRISVTARCNFRCTYCMPKEIFGRNFAFLARGQLLTFEEITRLARTFAREGVSKIRLTGGDRAPRHQARNVMVAETLTPLGQLRSPNWSDGIAARVPRPTTRVNDTSGSARCSMAAHHSLDQTGLHVRSSNTRLLAGPR